MIRNMYAFFHIERKEEKVNTFQISSEDKTTIGTTMYTAVEFKKNPEVTQSKFPENNHFSQKHGSCFYLLKNPKISKQQTAYRKKHKFWQTIRCITKISLNSKSQRRKKLLSSEVNCSFESRKRAISSVIS